MKNDSARDPALILHMLKAITLIQSYLANKTFNDFQNSSLLQDAVVREFMIIGEAMSNISDAFREKNPSIPFYEIIGMRNKMVHGYWVVDNETVWDAYKNDLPKLKKKLEKII